MFYSGWWPFWGFPVLPFVVAAVCIAIVASVVASRARCRSSTNWSDDRRSYSAALDILSQRFARGEIDRVEYEEKRRLILS